MQENRGSILDLTISEAEYPSPEFKGEGAYRAYQQREREYGYHPYIYYPD